MANRMSSFNGALFPYECSGYKTNTFLGFQQY
jgi:hypothetical protein